MIQARLHGTVEELAGLRDEWDRLAEACGRPCSAPDLLLAWWRTMAPEGASPRVVTVREDGRLVGLAPLLVERGALGVPLLRFLGTPHLPQRSAILASAAHEPAVLGAVAGCLAGSHPRPALVSLDRIDRLGAARSLARAWPAPLGTAIAQGFTVPAPVLSTGGRSFDEWLASRSSNFRRDIRRTTRRLADAGATIRRVAGPAELRSALDAFARLHGTRWGDRSQLWRPPTIAMLASAGETMLAPGRMRAYVAVAGDEIVAVEILFAAGGEVTSWNGGWDQAWAPVRPSMALLHRAIRDCFDGGERRFDLGEGEQPYKRRLAEGDDPVSWTALVPRGATYPAGQAALAPWRGAWMSRTLARRLPAPARTAIRRVRRRVRRRGRPRS